MKVFVVIKDEFETHKQRSKVHVPGGVASTFSNSICLASAETMFA